MINFKLAATGVLLCCVAMTGWAETEEREEMVISVRKRDENLQNVPVAVGVYNEETLKELNITGLDGIGKYNPSVTFDQGFAAQDTRITIRGLAPTRGRQNVAVLVDGIDVTGQAVQTNGGSLLINPRLFDLERVEVVKGPQNALYGRAAFNGAINYVTKKPTEDFETSVYADLGDNARYDVRGAVSGPIIGDVLLGGINLATWGDDGFYKNSVTGADVGGAEGYGASGALTWNITEKISTHLRVEYTDDEFDQSPYSNIVPTTGAPFPASSLGTVIAPGITSSDGTVNAIDAVRGSIPKDLQVTLSENPRTGADYPGVDRTILRGALTFDFDLGAVRLVSLTGYGDSTVDSFEDARREGSVAAPGKTTGGEFLVKDETTQFSQELRLQSNTDGRLGWTVGALYWQENVDFTDASVNCIGNASFVPFPPPGFFAPGENCAAPLAAITGADRYPDLWTRDQKHWSIYGLIDWEIIDDWSLILEGRYSDEEIEVTGPDRQAIGPPFAPGSRPGRDRAIDPRGIFFPTALMPAYGTIGDKVTDDFFAPKVTLQWDSTDNMMWYLSWAQSYKPAGIAIVGALDGFKPDSSKFEQEKLTVYEFGGKTSWLDNRLTANFAIFRQDFKDKQVTSLKQSASGILFAAPVNAASATVDGLEVDLGWQATDDINVYASYTYLDSEYDDYNQLSSGPAPIADAGNCAVTTVAPDPKQFCSLNLSGKALEYVPEHAVVAGADWQPQITSNINLLFGANYIYQDSRFTSAFNVVSLDSYSLWDFRAGFGGETWTVIGYVDNAFDDDTVKSSFANTYNQGIATAFPPFTFILPLNQTPILPDQRSVGVRMSYKFGGS
jgi:iron complex outermembrane receptor protein